MCDRWRYSFPAFLSDMGFRPSSKTSIDRIDNNGNYEPGNCRWADHFEQGRNKRNNLKFEVDGKVLTLSELSEISGLKNYTLKKRIQVGNMSPAAAMSEGLAYPHKVGLNGELLTYSELSEMSGIPKFKIWNRINTLGWSAEMAVLETDGRENAKYEFNGKLLSLGDWEKETGIKQRTLRARIKHGWGIETALTTKPNKWR